MTGGMVDQNAREAVYHLKVAAELFFASRPARPRPEYAPLAAEADPKEHLKDFVAVMAELFADETVSRRDLERIFFNAERAAGPDDGPITGAENIIYDTWERVLDFLPAAEPEEYDGSAAEASGDYGRLHFPRRRTSFADGN